MKEISFKIFIENSYESIQADIPLPKAVYTLSDLFTQNGATLFAVGGAIRDYLYQQHHDSQGKYSPKDVDLATEAPPDKVVEILNSDAAKRHGIKVFPKGEAFGVISAILDGEEFEIATFREEWYDPESGDGRRPDKVSYSTPAKDAQRRDLTMNALFYDIHSKEIRDYNVNHQGKGQGLEDIKNLVARPVGNAADRFREDKLRIPRLVRFFSRFNPGEIRQHLDPQTLQAIEEFKDLVGVSPERIANEFKSGLEKSKNPVNYILNYQAVGLMPAVFPNLQVDLEDVPQIGQIKNIKPVLAWLLKSNQSPQQVRSKLNTLKYPNDVSDTVAYLIQLLKFDPKNIMNYLRYRDARPHLGIEKDIADLAKIANLEGELGHFANYKQRTNSQDFMHLKGPEIGKAMSSAEADAYQKSKIYKPD